MPFPEFGVGHNTTRVHRAYIAVRSASAAARSNAPPRRADGKSFKGPCGTGARDRFGARARCSRLARPRQSLNQNGAELVDPALFQRYTAELVALSPDAILAQISPAVIAPRRETNEIPVLIVTVTDPVGRGFVAGLAYPGGNISGFSDFDATMVGKWLEMLTRVAVLFHPATAPQAGLMLRAIEDAHLGGMSVWSKSSRGCIARPSSPLPHGIASP
jgi:hypothetical protein